MTFAFFSIQFLKDISYTVLPLNLKLPLFELAMLPELKSGKFKCGEMQWKDMYFKIQILKKRTPVLEIYFGNFENSNQPFYQWLFRYWTLYVIVIYRNFVQTVSVPRLEGFSNICSQLWCQSVWTRRYDLEICQEKLSKTQYIY